MYVCIGGYTYILFGILTLISLSLKNKYKHNSKNLCLVKFEVLGYTNKRKSLRIISISD